MNSEPAGMKIAVSGSSGFIGTALVGALNRQGHQVIRLVRRQGMAASAAGANTVPWDPGAGELDGRQLEGVDAIVNLSGAGIGDHRWTDSCRRLLLQSRLDATRLLSRVAGEMEPRPRMLSASAVGYYGDRADELLTEESPSGAGFLADLCRQWEAATGEAEAEGVRVVRLRSGIVLGRGGGALRKQLPLFRFGLGGRLGSGRQWVSWISIDDEVAAMLHLLRPEVEVEGPVNLTAPEPVTNATFTRALARALHRPAIAVVPRPALAAAFGKGMTDEMLLASQRVVPEKLQSSGFGFLDATIERALTRLLAGGNQGKGLR